MFKRHYQKRSTNIVIVIFRVLLSLFMFTVLLGGVYAAYRQFSGLDPLKLDFKQVVNNVIAARTPKELIGALSSLKLDSKVLGKAVETNNQPAPQNTVQPVSVSEGKNLFVPAFRFLLVADTHNDNKNLEKAINQAKLQYPDLKFIIGLGDYSDVGTVEELKRAKTTFDLSALRYFLIPGDHDLWDCRNRSLVPTACFKEVFGLTYQAFIFDNFKFLLLNNSDNYKGIESEQLAWISAEFEKAKQEKVKGVFVFMHSPLYHPSSDRTMGKVEKSLKPQADMLLFQLQEAGVRAVFAGDIHYFSKYTEPKTNIPMVTAGAVTIERNPQAPRFAVVGVGSDGNIQVEDIEIKSSSSFPP